MGKYPPFKLIIIAAIVSFGGAFHFGFQLVVTNPSQSAFINFFNESHVAHYGWSMSESVTKSMWSVIVATLSYGAIFGSLVIDTVSTKVGRKRGLYVSIGMSIFAVLLAIISYHVLSFELYTVSRIILGFAITLSLGLTAMFLNESSPKQCRGFISMMTGILAQGGTFFGAIFAMPIVLGSDDTWWYLYLIELLILVAVLIILPFIPESPAFLTLCGDDEGARKAILFFHSCKIGAVDGPLTEIKENIKLNAKRMSAKAVFYDKYSRKGTIIGGVISFAACFSGTAVIYAFAVDMLRNTGLSLEDAAYGNVALCGVSMIASGSASFIVDRFGRRPLLIVTNGIIVILNIIVFALMFCFEKYQFTWIGYFLVVIIAIFLFTFSIGFGCLCFFMASELVGQSARGVAQSWASLVQMISRAFLLSVYTPIAVGVGQPFAYLILFILPVFSSFLYLYFNMPETKNKNYKEVLEALEKLPSFAKLFCLKKAASERQHKISNLGDDISCGVQRF